MTHRALVTKSFPGVEDGNVHPRTIGVGEKIIGDLAREAVVAGWATEIEDDTAPAPQPEKPPEAPTPANGSGEDKSKVLDEDKSKAADQIKIPADWRSMKWGLLKPLADKIKGSEVHGAEDARKVIESEVARRAPAEKATESE